MKIKAHYLINFCLVISLIAVVASCTKPANKDKDHLVFRYNEHANISSLDPVFAKDQRNIWPTHQLYNTLVRLDDSLQIQPDLAKQWQLSDDGLHYTFQLRENVFFHPHAVFGKDSTRTVNAHDVVYSLNRLSDKKVASPGSWILRNVKHISAQDSMTVAIELKQNFPAFLGLLSMKFCSVVPVEMDKESMGFRTAPIGTGPFLFKRWEENEKLVLRKNPFYFETDKNGKQLPYLEAVAITFLPEKQSEFMEFVQGKLDFLSGLDPSYKDEIITADGVLKPKYQSAINMQTAPYLNTEYLGFHLADASKEVQSKKLRQAINYAFNRKTMIKYLRNGIGIPAENGFIPKGLPGFTNQKGYSYQPQKAKKLVEEFKAESGIKNPEITISTNASYVDFVEFIQKQLQKIGIQAKLNVMPPSTLLQQRSAGNLAVFRASWIADYPDAENYLSLFYSKNFSPQGPNYTHFRNDVFDSIYEKSLTENELQKRAKLYAKMDSIIIKNAPVIPLYYDEVVRFRQKNISGLGINPFNLLELKKVRKKKTDN
ncbi:MAG: ABC transporter substrate-binding protein [Bacteroidota bacterium]